MERKKKSHFSVKNTKTFHLYSNTTQKNKQSSFTMSTENVENEAIVRNNVIHVRIINPISNSAIFTNNDLLCNTEMIFVLQF